MPRKKKTEAERIAEALTTAADYIRTQNAEPTASPTHREPAAGTPRKYKTSEARRRASNEYYKRNADRQKANAKTIGATLPKAEAEAITAIFKGAGVKPAEVIRATAHGLTSGTQTAEAIRQAVQAWTDSQPKPAAGETDTESGTPAPSPTDNPDGGNE